MLRVAGTLSKSTEVMKMVNTIIRAPELQKTVMEMSKGARATPALAQPLARRRGLCVRSGLLTSPTCQRQQHSVTGLVSPVMRRGRVAVLMQR
jgi:hypothetical protein